MLPLMDYKGQISPTDFIKFEYSRLNILHIVQWMSTLLVLTSLYNFLGESNFLFLLSITNRSADAHALSGLVKKWFQELKEDLEEQLQARFVFKSNLLGSTNQISCNLCTSFNQIIDEFVPCKV